MYEIKSEYTIHQLIIQSHEFAELHLSSQFHVIYKHEMSIYIPPRGAEM